MQKEVYLQPGKDSPVRRGHPWIFPKAILQSVGNPRSGDLVTIFSAQKLNLGIGVYNEKSLYCVRVLTLSAENIAATTLTDIVKERLNSAIVIRRSLNLPNALTSAYRLFNSEADGLSGLTIDRFNHTLVVSSSAFWVEAQQRVIMDILKQLLPNDSIHWVSQKKPLALDGWEVQDSEPKGAPTTVCEAGVYYEVDFANSQKTGLFLDQRENHQRIGALACGKRVLDLYTYTGGFALHAAKGGALSVTAVDSSAAAIKQAERNAALNNLAAIKWIEGDAKDYLASAGDYDLVILDPPKLIPSKRHLQQAKNLYRFLHGEIFKNLLPGSLLLTCNCSAALSSEDFVNLVSAGAQAVGKRARILGIYGPANCHPTLAAFPEGNYLTAVLLAV